MVNGHHFTFKLLLAAALAASLLLTLAKPVQAQNEAGVVTIQAANPKTPTVGQPLTFTISVENNSVAQRVGIIDFLPSGVSLISATPSQGTCDIPQDSVMSRNVVECAFGVVPSGSAAKAEIVVTPTAAGAMTNTAVATAEFSPATPANSSSATVKVKPVAVSGT
jgi:uncharacterized repeat protein (TIGR01451 family)